MGGDSRRSSPSAVGNVTDRSYIAVNHTYASAGTFTASLQVTNAGTTETATVDIRVFDLAGRVVVNGGASDVQVTLPRAVQGSSPRTYELRLTTSPLHKLRQGTEVLSGEKDLVEAQSISIYRT